MYTEANEEVVPEVLGFSETNIPTTSIAMKTEKKVAVRFKVLFTRGHRADPNPLVRAVSLKSVAGILIHENSLVAVGKTLKLVFNSLITMLKKHHEHG